MYSTTEEMRTLYTSRLPGMFYMYVIHEPPIKAVDDRRV